MKRRGFRRKGVRERVLEGKRVHRGERVDASSHTALNRGSEKKKRNQEWAHIVEGQFRERFFFWGGGERERRGKRRSNSWIRPACGQRWMGRKNNGPTHPSLSFLCLSHSSFLLLSICGNGGGHSFKYQHCEKMSKSTCYLTLSP